MRRKRIYFQRKRRNRKLVWSFYGGIGINGWSRHLTKQRGIKQNGINILQQRVLLQILSIRR